MALAAVLLLVTTSYAIPPKFSWDYVGNMTFFHSCNESGLYSDEALETILKFPFVTIEKGQGFNDKSGRFAEQKIVEQLKVIKERDPSIATVMYMNSVLDWYFYEMHVDFQKHPQWWLRSSKDGNPVMAGGDPHFNPPKKGMHVFDHAQDEVRAWWAGVCYTGVQSGYVDGCFSDSSQPGTHGSDKTLNASYTKKFEDGKVQTMTEVTAHFGGTAGKPYNGSTGVLIGKKPDQLGINAYQIEMFSNNEASIQELMAGVKQGYLVQCHVETPEVEQHGCPYMNDTVAAFLIGAGENSYYGSGPWISPNLAGVQMAWCPPLFEQPLGKPTGDAVKSADGVWSRSFASGTTVTFNAKTNKGHIAWSS